MTNVIALAALFGMTAERRGAADFYRPHDAQLLERQFARCAVSAPCS